MLHTATGMLHYVAEILLVLCYGGLAATVL